MLFEGDCKNGTDWIKQPSAAVEAVTVETRDQQDGKTSFELRIGYQPSHGCHVDVARTDSKAWVTVPLADVVVTRVLVCGAVEKPHGITCSLEDVDHKTGESPRPFLKGQFGRDEIRGSELLPEYLATYLPSASTLQSVAEVGDLVSRKPYDYSFHAPVKSVEAFKDWLGQDGWRVRATVMSFGDQDADLDILRLY